MHQWIIDSAIATEEEVKAIETEAKKFVNESKRKAWENFLSPIRAEIKTVTDIFSEIASESSQQTSVEKISNDLLSASDAMRREIFSAVKKVLLLVRDENISAKHQLKDWLSENTKQNSERYSSYLHSET